MTKKIYKFQSLDSTNAKAKELAQLGYPHGTVILAKEQTKGRGRSGRTWDSQKDSGIYMTILLRPQMVPDHAHMLTLVAALAVAEAITVHTQTHVQIKWPNDIVIGNRKVCGILTEMSLVDGKMDYVIVGIGVNVHQTTFPDELKEIAGSLYSQCHQHFRRKDIVDGILSQFEQYYAIFFKTQDLSKLKDVYESYLVNLQKEVRVLDPKVPFLGIATGITQNGELIVDTPQGRKLISAGEVSVRGLYGYVE